MTTEYEHPAEPSITEILRRMVDLAKQVTTPPNSPDSNRMARIAMEMAINSLDSPSPSPVTDSETLETMLLKRVAEKREKRWEERVEEVKRRMWEEREKEMEWQEVKYEALRKREEAERARLLEEVRRAREDVARARSEVESFKLEAARAKKDAEQARVEAEAARNEAEVAKKQTQRAKEQTARAMAEAQLERLRADKAEMFQVQEAAMAEATRQSIEAQQDAMAWARYQSQWRLFKRVTSVITTETVELFRFEDIPWPTVLPPHSPAMITDAEVASFLFSGPPLREGESLRTRIKDCLLTWHPDKFSGRWIRFVVESDRAKVVEGIHAVTRASNKALADYTTSPRPEEQPVPRPTRVSRERRVK